MLREGGDRGGLIVLASSLEMVSLILLDLRSVINVHVLNQAIEARRAQRRRRMSARASSSPRRRTSRRDVRDGSEDFNSLMQTPVNGKLVGPIPKQEAVKVAANLVKQVDPVTDVESKMLLRMDLQVRAVRNLKSKVPALREVANHVIKDLETPNKKVVEMKKQGKKLWMQLRRAALKWARKKATVELLQTGWALTNVDGSEVMLMQTQIDLAEESPTEPIEVVHEKPPLPEMMRCGFKGCSWNWLASRKGEKSVPSRHNSTTT